MIVAISRFQIADKHRPSASNPLSLEIVESVTVGPLHVLCVAPTAPLGAVIFGYPMSIVNVALSQASTSHRVRLGRPPFKPPIDSNPNGSSGNTADPPCPPPLKSTSSHDHLADTMSDRRNSVPSCRMPRSGEAFEMVVRRKSCAAAEKRGRY